MSKPTVFKAKGKPNPKIATRVSKPVVNPVRLTKEVIKPGGHYERKV